jgi:large subunit ribosomal protein L24
MLKTTKQRTQKSAPRKAHVRKNDVVLITSGRDRGKQGRVLRVLPAEGKAVVEHVNMIKKHTRKNPGKNQKGGILEREAPLRLSNLKVICPACSEPTRTGSKEHDGERVRKCVKCGEAMG